VISFGVAGGLDPSLKSGDVVVATEVVNGTSRWRAGLALSEELINGSGLGGQKVVRAGLAGAEQVVLEQAGKAVLHATTGASAVDMESHIAAAYATAAGLPFAALRVISDPATRALPAIARNAIKPNGNIDLKKVLRGLARNPFTLGALVSTGVDFNRALRSLRGCRNFLLGGESLVPADYMATPSVARPRGPGHRKGRTGESVPARGFSGLRANVSQPRAALMELKPGSAL
jgi:hopanoid-associated phosphorylase